MPRVIKTVFPLLIYIFTTNPVVSEEELERLEVIDWHTHVAGLGYGDSGNFVNEKMQNNFRFWFFMKWMNVNKSDLENHGDRIVVERLNTSLVESRFVDKAVVLAIDGRINRETGELDKVNTLYYVDNNFVANEVSKYPKLLFGASINPHRSDSIELLEKVHGQGAVLIKWIPSIMDIDPANEKIIPFYKKMAELNLPLLSHTGDEHSFPDADNSLADPRRLILALESGVTVIAAHMATTGRNNDERNFNRILPMIREYENLYADISSLTQINKLGYLAETLDEPGISLHLLYGSDWPLQNFPVVSPWYHLRHIGVRNAWRIAKIKNQWDRDIELKKAFGVSEAVFSRKVGRVNEIMFINNN